MPPSVKSVTEVDFQIWPTQEYYKPQYCSTVTAHINGTFCVQNEQIIYILSHRIITD